MSRIHTFMKSCRKAVTGFLAAVLTVFCVSPAAAADRPLKISYATLVATSTADAASSWGGYEKNPLLAGRDGKFGAKGLAVKFGITAGLIEVEHLITKHHPETKKPFAIANFVASGLLTGIAVRNFKIRHRPS